MQALFPSIAMDRRLERASRDDSRERAAHIDSERAMGGEGQRRVRDHRRGGRRFSQGCLRGTFTLTDKHEPESCTVRASARGSAGSVDTTAHMRLEDGQNGGARMHYKADAKVTGALAGVGQRLIGAAAKKTTKEFLERQRDGTTETRPARRVDGRRAAERRSL